MFFADPGAIPASEFGAVQKYGFCKRRWTTGMRK